MAETMPSVEDQPDGDSIRPKSMYVTGSTLTFHDIHYTVQVDNPDKFCRKVPKEILQGVSGAFPPGMNAIMGPTGGGKSSLLDILAGRKDPLGLSGAVLVDGQRQPENFKFVSGYVVQDDIVMGTLTVRENFMFSANVRLPSTVSTKEKENRVREIVKELGLEDCADRKVGNEFIRGVSGGERKRTIIGMELVILPTVLFLDEPTTGLDANTASSIMRLLHSLARKGRTVIFSIHQPRFAIFKLFDRLTLLGKGRTVFHGPADEGLNFFTHEGYQCESFNNPADFFLDVILGDYAKHSDSPTRLYENVSLAVRDSMVMVEVAGESENAEPCSQLADAFQTSSWNEKLQAEIGPVYDLFQATQSSYVGSNPKYATSFFTQLWFLSKRTLVNIYRNPMSSLMQWTTAVIFAILTGFVYRELNLLFPDGIQNRVGALFFIIMNVVFSTLSSLELFIKERVIFMHENVSGYYRVSAYFTSKVFCDIIPMRVVPTIPFSAITYFMIGFDNDAEKFFFYMLTLVVASLAAAAVGFLFGAICKLVAVGNLAVALAYVLMMIFGGLLVNINGIAEWLRWLQYFSIFRFSMKALLINELKNMNFYTEIPSANGTTKLWIPAGNRYLEEQSIDYHTQWHLWQNILALFCLFVGFLVLSYVQLRFIKKLK